ncbi:MAG: hypothetical protein M3Q64_02735 [bacterium]|nr:hypothetical protein [bacterium]
MELSKEYFDEQFNKLDVRLETFATKDDLKRFATKDDLDDRLKDFATKDDLANFATKDDLANFATKDDLKSFARKDDLANFATKDDLANQTVELKVFAEEKVEGLAVLVSKGFEDMYNRLDVRERVNSLEYDMKRLKKSLLVD